MSVGLLAVVLMLTVAVLAMFWPSRHAREAGLPNEGEIALELARDSKLAELNDLELDFRLGKLSADDYLTVKAAMRLEAVEILRQIEASAGNGKPAGHRGRRR